MRGQPELYVKLEELTIDFEYLEHPPVRTVEELDKYSKDWGSTRCKNLFFRNHKGNKHYLVILRHDRKLSIKDLEQLLKQGKITFASEWRLEKYLGLKPGAVSPFGLINDTEKHIHIFIDETLSEANHLTFHPNTNDASLKITYDALLKFLAYCGNEKTFLRLY